MDPFLMWVLWPKHLKENQNNKEDKGNLECKETSMTNVNGRDLYMEGKHCGRE
jgi:hypothetical protein